jgi:hypothetical protein
MLNLLVGIHHQQLHASHIHLEIVDPRLQLVSLDVVSDEEQRSRKAATNLATIFFDLIPQHSPNGPGVTDDSLQQDIVSALDLLILIKIDLDPTLQQTPKVLQNVKVPGQMVAADPLVHLDPKCYCYTGGKGEFTQWAHCEFFVSPETICLVVTQQVCGGFF